MGEMVERVARAIAEAHEEEWGRLDDLSRDVYRVEARAAIAAMREPTVAMDGAGYDASDLSWKQDPGAVRHIEVWEAMIDAAIGRQNRA